VICVGQRLFSHDGLFGAFGTEEEPVLVPSHRESRVVGCYGGYVYIFFILKGVLYDAFDVF